MAPAASGAYGTDHADLATTLAATRCFPELDPLVAMLCEGAGPPAWVDPMLDELAASLVMSRPTGAPVHGSPSTPAGPLLLGAGHDGRDVAEGPMIVELVASHPVIQSARAQTIGPSPPVLAATVEEDEAPHTTTFACA